MIEAWIYEPLAQDKHQGYWYIHPVYKTLSEALSYGVKARVRQ